MPGLRMATTISFGAPCWLDLQGFMPTFCEPPVERKTNRTGSATILLKISRCTRMKSGTKNVGMRLMEKPPSRRRSVCPRLALRLR